MPTQAQEIDGHVLINDIESLGDLQLKAGDFIEVQITEAMPHDLVGSALRLVSRSKHLQELANEMNVGLRRAVERPKDGQSVG